MNLRLIDEELLDSISSEARSSARGRKNHNFHPSDDFPAHRLLNAIEPGSYIAPHRHLDAHKDETMVVLRGRLGIICFDVNGDVIKSAQLGPQDNVMGVDIPHGLYHTVLALEPSTVFLEAKAGPYMALSDQEKATWAPAEGDATAPSYYAKLRALFTESRSSEQA